MDANFWAKVLSDIVGGFNVLLNNNVSSRINDTMQAVTKSKTFVLSNSSDFLTFYRQVFFLALIIAVVIGLWNIVFGLIRRRPDIIRRSLADFFGTFLIGAFGLTIYSGLAALADGYSDGVTSLAKTWAGTRGNWYDTIIQIQNSANPASSGVSYGFSQVGAYLLANQVQFIQFSVVPVLIFTLLAFVLRDGRFGGVFLKLSLVSLMVVLFTKAGVATWLAIWSVVLSFNATVGVSQILILAFVFCSAGQTSLILFILFFAGYKKFRTEVVGGLKQLFRGQKAQDMADREVMDVPGRPSPNVNPSINPSSNSSASPSVRERGERIMDRGRQTYGKGREYFESGRDKVEKTNRVAQKVVMVSGTVGTVASFVAPKTAAVPYLGPIVAGVAVAATATNAAGQKVVSATNATLHPVSHMERKNNEREKT